MIKINTSLGVYRRQEFWYYNGAEVDLGKQNNLFYQALIKPKFPVHNLMEFHSLITDLEMTEEEIRSSFRVSEHNF